MHAMTEVVAHRGASGHAAEHTLAAYDLALAQGTTTLELDVRRDRQGRLVVLHDPTLARTLGDPRAIGEVASDDLPAECRPLTLDGVLARYATRCDWLVELKDPDHAMAAAAVAALERHGVTGRATVQSFDHRALARLRRQAPHVRVAPLVPAGVAPRDVLVAVRRARPYAAALGVHHRSVDASVVLAAHAAGLRVRAWTVNDPGDMARLLGAGVDGLITDFPDLAAAAVAGQMAVTQAA